jgi:protein-tyrosine-phosphatase
VSQPFRVLFICTGNSARSQMAEALLTARGAGRFAAASAGTWPAGRVSRRAIGVLGELGIDWTGHTPRGFDGRDHESWDLVVTVCDAARQSCPVFPHARAVAHWNLADPMDATGTEEEVREAFRRTRDTIAGLIEGLIALPVEALPPRALAKQVSALGLGAQP